LNFLFPEMFPRDMFQSDKSFSAIWSDSRRKTSELDGCLVELQSLYFPETTNMIISCENLLEGLDDPNTINAIETLKTESASSCVYHHSSDSKELDDFIEFMQLDFSGEINDESKIISEFWTADAAIPELSIKLQEHPDIVHT
ncbi:29954_t:CDS:2, partial [Racocetra persica]